jgi:hypothetical protein
VRHLLDIIASQAGSAPSLAASPKKSHRASPIAAPSAQALTSLILGIAYFSKCHGMGLDIASNGLTVSDDFGLLGSGTCQLALADRASPTWPTHQSQRLGCGVRRR